MDIDPLRHEIELFLRELAEETYLQQAGLRQQSQLARVYDRVDPAFCVARYLRGWILEAQLKDYLYDRFDEEWFRNDRTGPFLMELWPPGPETHARAARHLA